jgi:hypothetical protein
MVNGIDKEQVCHEEHQEETSIKLKNRYIMLENVGSTIKDVCWRRESCLIKLTSLFHASLMVQWLKKKCHCHHCLQTCPRTVNLKFKGVCNFKLWIKESNLWYFSNILNWRIEFSPSRWEWCSTTRIIFKIFAILLVVIFLLIWKFYFCNTCYN